MINYAAPTSITYSDVGIALTFVVPARKCNLNCSFCIIEQRKEALRHSLNIDDYIWFMKDIISQEPLAVISIQGYEPLLPESWGYTKAIMHTARAHGLTRSFITNGTYLSEKSNEIIELDPTGFAVSIDSAKPQRHDKIRGLQGAFELTIKGLDDIIRKKNTIADKITISSVLMPKKRHFLDGMPQLLAELGITHWSISPLINVGYEQLGGPVDGNQHIIDDVLHLSDIAKTYGISVVLDDELRTIPRDQIDFGDLIIRSLERPEGLIRLAPNGSCSIGSDILKEVGPASHIWQPNKETPSAFINKIRKQAPHFTQMVA